MTTLTMEDRLAGVMSGGECKRWSQGREVLTEARGPRTGVGWPVFSGDTGHLGGFRGTI